LRKVPEKEEEEEEDEDEEALKERWVGVEVRDCG
jgi:hypothetical protein